MIELPIRFEYNYSKRVPGNFEFFHVSKIAATGKVYAIPESEIGRFIKLAQEEGFDKAQVGDEGYLPSYWNAVGEIGKATIELEHTGQLRFFRNYDSYWVTWDAEHPAPTATVNGEEITNWYLAEIPASPGPMAVQFQ